MVTWGQNTVHSVPGNAPAAPAAGGLFGSPAPAPTTAGLFGTPAAATTPPATNTSPAKPGLFGTPAAPASSSLFGSTPAPAPSGGLFGTPAPATSSIFGSSPAPAATSSIFGAPAASTTSSLFGAPAPATNSLFGAPAANTATPTNAPAPTTTLPAQAALQAHQDAISRQEEARVQSSLQSIHDKYSGTAAANGKRSAPFCTVVYNPLSPQERQMQATLGLGNGSSIPPRLLPDRPPQISEADWDKALVENPDPANYRPVALVGAAALQGRLSHQQELSNAISNQQLKQLREAQQVARTVQAQLVEHAEYARRRQTGLEAQVLAVLRKVELVRGLHQNLQPDERLAIGQLQQAHQTVHHLAAATAADAGHRDASSSSSSASNSSTATAAAARVIPDSWPPEDRLFQVLSRHRDQLTELTGKVQRDLRDLQLLSERLQQQQQQQQKAPKGPPVPVAALTH